MRVNDELDDFARKLDFAQELGNVEFEFSPKNDAQENGANLLTSCPQ